MSIVIFLCVPSGVCSRFFISTALCRCVVLLCFCDRYFKRWLCREECLASVFQEGGGEEALQGEETLNWIAMGRHMSPLTAS